MKKRLLLVSVVLVCSAIVNIEVMAESPVHSVKNTNSGKQLNQGFIKNPPAELKKKFPMCDEFLNVDWIRIDKEASKAIGYVKHDVYKVGKKSGVMESLVYIMKYEFPLDMLDLYEFRGEKREALMEAIEKGDVTEGNRPIARYQNNKFPLYTNKIEDSYSNYTRTVCVVNPVTQRAWLVEGKRLGKIFDDEYLWSELNPLHVHFPEILLENMKRISMIDINQDGLMDYFYFEVIWVNGADGFEYINQKTYRYDRVGGFFSKKAMKSCEVHHYRRVFITTDGNDFYINDQCNINELIK